VIRLGARTASAEHGLYRLEDASRLYAEVEAAQARRAGPHSTGAIAARTGRAEALFRMGQREEAVELARATSTEADAHLGPDHERARAALITLVFMLRDGVDVEQSERLARELVEREARSGGPDTPSSLRARLALAEIHFDQGRGEDAEREIRAIVATKEGVYGVDSVAASESRAMLAIVLEEIGRVEAAVAIYERELALHTAQLGPATQGTCAFRLGIARRRIVAGTCVEPRTPRGHPSS